MSKHVVYKRHHSDLKTIEIKAAHGAGGAMCARVGYHGGVTAGACCDMRRCISHAEENSFVVAFPTKEDDRATMSGERLRIEGKEEGMRPSFIDRRDPVRQEYRPALASSDAVDMVGLMDVHYVALHIESVKVGSERGCGIMLVRSGANYTCRALAST